MSLRARRPEEIDHADCPLCAGPIAPLFEKNGHRIDRCRRCRFAFVNPTPPERAIADFYNARESLTEAEAIEEAMTRGARRPTPAWAINWILRRLPAGTLLDVGCGYGLSARRAAEAGLRVTALEPSRVKAAAATRILGQAPIAGAFEDFDGGPFDAIFMSQVLEHAREPVWWLERARALLNPGALLMIASPNFGSPLTRLLGSRDPYVTPPAHLNYFDLGNLTDTLGRAGFEVLERATVASVPGSAFRRLGPAASLGGALYAGVSPVIDALKAGMILRVLAQAA